MMRNLDTELKELKREFAKAKNEEIRLQTRLEEAKNRRKEAGDSIKEKGYDVKTLPKVIQEKEEELANTIDEIKSYLPGDNNDREEDEDWE